MSGKWHPCEVCENPALPIFPETGMCGTCSTGEADAAFEGSLWPPQETEPWFVYILRVTASTGRKTIHVGISKDPDRRLLDHKAGKVKATAGKHVHLLATSFPMNQAAALRIEADLKKESADNKENVAIGWGYKP